MLRRAENLLRRLGRPGTTRVWGGTYHAIATRLLHRYGKAIGLPPQFTVHDRGRLRRPAERRPHRVEPGQDRQAVSQEGHLHGDLQPVRQRPRKARRRAARPFPLVQGLARRVEAALRRLRGPQGGGRRARLRRPAALLARPAGRCRKRGKTPLSYPSTFHKTSLSTGDAVRRLFDCVLVDEYQDTNTLQAEILYLPLARGQGADRRGRRRPVDLRLPRRHRAQHPRLSQALPERHDRHAGAELPQHAADPGGHQPRDRPGPRAIYQEPLVRSGPKASGRGWSTARTTPTRPSTSSARFWSTARRASICGGRPCCSGPRTTACCWKPSWPGPTSPSTSTAG